MKKKRVGIVGVGNVGSTLAYALATKAIADEIVLQDVREDYTKALALDISQAACLVGSKSVVKVASKHNDFKDCKIIVITAGVARKPNMSRDDLLFTNAKIMKTVVTNITKYNTDSIIIVVSNPLDAMVYTALKASNFTRERIIGMAGVLDSSRMAYFIKEKVDAKSIEALVIGGHGDHMVPLVEISKIDGLPITEFLNEDEIDEIVSRTKKAGLEIVELLKNGSAYFAPAHSILVMIEAILEDKKKIYPCSVQLEGEYGFSDVVTGVPTLLGKDGVEKIVEYKLSKEQMSNLSTSVNGVKRLIDKLDEYTNQI